MTDPRHGRQEVREGPLRGPRACALINRRFPLIVLAGLALPALAGWAITGTLAGAATGLLWGGLVRVFLVHHVTWSVNSVCHFLGTRRFETDDESRNVFWLALPSFGESWHHNHHAFPRSAEHGLRALGARPLGARDQRARAGGPGPQRGADRPRAPAGARDDGGRRAGAAERLAALALHDREPRAHALRLVALERAEDHVAARRRSRTRSVSPAPGLTSGTAASTRPSRLRTARSWPSSP